MNKNLKSIKTLLAVGLCVTAFFFSCSSNEDSLNENITSESNKEEEFSTMIESFLEDNEKASKTESGRRASYNKQVDCSDLRFITRFDIYNRATIINAKFKYKYGNKTYAIVKKNRTGNFRRDYQVYGICGRAIVFPQTNTNTNTNTSIVFPQTNTTINSNLVGLWRVVDTNHTPRNAWGLTVRIDKDGNVQVKGCSDHWGIKINKQNGSAISFNTSGFYKVTKIRRCTDKRDDYVASIIKTLSKIQSYTRVGNKMVLSDNKNPLDHNFPTYRLILKASR